MPVKYEVLHDGRLIVEWWSGEASDRDVTANLDAQLADPRIADDCVKLADFREATVPDTTLTGLGRIARHGRKHVKTALFIKDETWPVAQAAEVEVLHPGLALCCWNLMNKREMLPAACHWLSDEKHGLYIDPELVEAELQRLASS